MFTPIFTLGEDDGGVRHLVVAGGMWYGGWRHGPVRGSASVHWRAYTVGWPSVKWGKSGLDLPEINVRNRIKVTLQHQAVSSCVGPQAIIAKQSAND